MDFSYEELRVMEKLIYLGAKIMKDRIKNVLLLYSILNTVFLIINYINPLNNLFMTFLIVLNCIYLIYFGSKNNIKYSEHIKLLIAIYILVFLFNLINDNYFSKGVYSVYNNLMIALVPPIWVVSIYNGNKK